jgi:crotonobetainyl-CoA:carnitine CoA-transferase CaiB-like acyl-CoA transferase
LVDFSGGYVAALALLSGLHAARRDGVGMDCDVSLYDVAIGMLNYPAAWHLNKGFEPQRTRHSAHPSLVPFQAFEAENGWLVIGCAKEKFWVRLAQVLGRAEWVVDPRFVDFDARHENRDVLIPLLEDELRQKPVAEWLLVLGAEGVPCAPIQTVAEALADDHTAARDLVVNVEHPRFGTVKQVASPVRVGNQRPEYRRAPRRNEDQSAVIGGIGGYSPSEIADLAMKGAFGAVPDSTVE